MNDVLIFGQNGSFLPSQFGVLENSGAETNILGILSPVRDHGVDELDTVVQWS